MAVAAGGERTAELNTSDRTDWYVQLCVEDCGAGASALRRPIRRLLRRCQPAARRLDGADRAVRFAPRLS